MKSTDVMAAASRPRVPFKGRVKRDWLRLDFPAKEYRSRLRRLRSMMEKNGMEALVVYGEPLAWERMGDVRWISGFASIHGHAVVVIPIDGEPSLIIDGSFHGEPMHSYAWMSWIEDIRPVTGGYGFSKLSEEISLALNRRGTVRGKVGFVGDELLLRALLKGRRCVNASVLYIQSKAVKSELELEAIRDAGKATTAGFDEAIRTIAVGRTEKQIVGEAMKAMYSAGADSAGLIVISGPRGWLKHADPDERPMERGDMAYLRGGATVRGYTCEVSRSLVLGEPTNHQRQLLDDVHDAYSTITSMMRRGASTRSLYEEATKLAREGRYPEKAGKYSYVDFSVSHGIGTSFLELPTIYHVADGDRSTLEHGMCMAFEPMIIAFGLGTAVVENTVVIGESGAQTICDVETKLW